MQNRCFFRRWSLVVCFSLLSGWMAAGAANFVVKTLAPSPPYINGRGERWGRVCGGHDNGGELSGGEEYERV